MGWTTDPDDRMPGHKTITNPGTLSRAAEILRRHDNAELEANDASRELGARYSAALLCPSASASTSTRWSRTSLEPTWRRARSANSSSWSMGHVRRFNLLPRGLDRRAVGQALMQPQGEDEVRRVRLGL